MLDFRPAHPQQHPAIDLVNAMIAELEPLYGRIDRPDMPAAGPETFLLEGASFLVGWDGEDPVCCGGIKRLDAQMCEIKRMYIVPAARGRGVAAKLLRALEANARRSRYLVARLDTGPHQPYAERLYRGAGYAPIENFNANPMASFWGEKRLEPA